MFIVSQLTSDALLQIQLNHLQLSSNGEVRETVNESSRLLWPGVGLSSDVRLKEDSDSAGLSIMLGLLSKLYANTATGRSSPSASAESIVVAFVARLRLCPLKKTSKAEEIGELEGSR